MGGGWVIPLCVVLLACSAPPSPARPPLQAPTWVGARPERVAHLDDPASCVDVPSSADRATEADKVAIESELQGHLERQWSSVRSCLGKNPGKDPVNIQIEVGPDGKSTARVIDARLTRCKAVDCIRDRLSGLQVALPKSDRSFKSGQRLDVDPAAPRHFHAEAWLSAAEDTPGRLACLDEPVGGRLPQVFIREKVRAGYGEFRNCYADGLARNAELQGLVTFRFVIGVDGKISRITVEDNELADCAVVKCVHEAFAAIAFPPPEGGVVTVIYPIRLMPGRSPAPAATAP